MGKTHGYNAKGKKKKFSWKDIFIKVKDTNVTNSYKFGIGFWKDKITGITVR